MCTVLWILSPLYLAVRQPSPLLIAYFMQCCMYNLRVVFMNGVEIIFFGRERNGGGVRGVPQLIFALGPLVGILTLSVHEARENCVKINLCLEDLNLCLRSWNQCFDTKMQFSDPSLSSFGCTHTGTMYCMYNIQTHIMKNPCFSITKCCFRHAVCWIFTSKTDPLLKWQS